MAQAVSALDEDCLFIFLILGAESALIPTTKLSVLLSEEEESERLLLDTWTGRAV